MPEGLLNAQLLDGKGGARRLDWAGVRAWKPEEGLLWVHLHQQSTEAHDWLNNESGLDWPAADALLAEETRPRATPHGDSLVLILRGVNLNPGADPEDMVSLRLWSDGKRIITTRIRRLLAIEDLEVQLDRGEGPSDAGDLIAMLAEYLVERASGVIEDSKDRIDELEETVLTTESRQLRPVIAEAQREAVLLRRYLAPQAAALQRLSQEHYTWLSERLRSRLRESGDSVMRYVEDLDAVRDRAALVQEALASRIADRIEFRMYTVTLIATVFLPATFITGLLGINVGGIPGADNTHAFLVVCGMLAVVCGGLLVYLRRSNWL